MKENLKSEKCCSWPEQLGNPRDKMRADTTRRHCVETFYKRNDEAQKRPKLMPRTNDKKSTSSLFTRIELCVCTTVHTRFSYFGGGVKLKKRKQTVCDGRR
jgi:hypothetical protein